MQLFSLLYTKRNPFSCKRQNATVFVADAKRNYYYVVVSFLTYIHLQQASTNSAVSYIPYKA